MKIVIVAGLVVGVSAFVFNTFNSLQKADPISRPENSSPSTEEQTAIEPVDIQSQAIFIPYWNIPSSSADLSEYDTLIYFGIAPDTNGSLMGDAGLQNVDRFIQNTSSGKERMLTVRMLNSEINTAILDDISHQSTIIGKAIDLANQYGFDGIVLDLEMSVIPFSHVQHNITSFISSFAESAQAEDMDFAITIYGDTFYRGRPYDIEALGKYVDEMYIMAYDFHKSRGEPGPNFPLDRQSLGDGGSAYPYDFKHMITDFSSVVSREKLTVIFGMYGYDWTLGEQGLPLKAAKAIPLREIDTSGAIEDPVSQEKHVTYTDDEGYRHELWFEDEESVDVKIDYLQEQGIGQVGYWVWGYF